jgi:hypothetical protein
MQFIYFETNKFDHPFYNPIISLFQKDQEHCIEHCSILISFKLVKSLHFKIFKKLIFGNKKFEEEINNLKKINENGRIDWR